MDQLSHFQGLENHWVAGLLASPDYEPIATDSRAPKPSGEDSYFGAVLATPTTIPHVLTLRRKEIGSPATQPPPPEDPKTIWPAPTAAPSSAPAVNPADVVVLVDLSAPGICGHPETVHGGVVATLLDEAMSLAVSSHVGVGTGSDNVRGGESEENPRGKIYTAQLDVRYKRPLLVPAVAVVKARVVARQGRKFWVRAQLMQEEKNEEADRHLEWPKRKVVTTDAMAFWIQTRASL